MTDTLFQTDSARNRSDRSISNQHSRRASLNQHSRHTSLSASVRSWLLSTPNPPPPPPELTITPLSASRPLPKHPYSNMVRSQGPFTLPPLQVTNPSEDDFDNVGHDRVRMHDGLVTEEVRRGQRDMMQHPAQTAIRGQPRNRSFGGEFVRGLKTLPKKVLRRRGSAEKRRPALIAEEAESTEAVTTLPRYRSNPSIVGPSMVTYVQATDMPVPELHDRLPADALRSVRPRHPSYRVMPPSVHGLAEEQSAQVYNMPPADPPTFQESTPPPEADQATTLIYDNPADVTSTTNGQPQSQSLRISYISHHTHAPTLNSATPQYAPSQTASDIQENPVPVVAHPPLSTDYRKMSLASHDAASPTTLTSSSSLEPSFSAELSPVRRFLHFLHSLPWVSNERITSDYHPGGGSDPKKKPLVSWYRRAESSSRRNSAAPVDLLSPGTPDSRVERRLSNSSTAAYITSPRLETRRVRQSRSRLQPQRHQHSHGRHQRHHRHHHHRHHHERHRRRRSSPAAVDDEVQDDYRHTTAPPPGYPSPFQYPYPYPIPPAASPRGPRSHRSPGYPGGYVPFQPMPPTPPAHSPLYVFATNPPSQGSDFADPGQPMYVLPGGFHPNHHAMASPFVSDQAANISPDSI